MKAVYYSLVMAQEPAIYQRQWIRSIGSLRKFNSTIPVYLFLFNEPTPEILRKADEYQVIVKRAGGYRDCLGELAGDHGAALSHIPTLNKLLPLGTFDTSVSQLLFLDCDTFFFGDVTHLFLKYQSCQWYAREEPHSRRSPFLPYSPPHVDEDALAGIAAETGVVFIPPYNSGVVLLNHGLHLKLFALRKEFLTYAWRLTLGAELLPEITLPAQLRECLTRIPQPGRLGGPIRFPSGNYWILEQIALWLTLGRIPNLSHAQFAMEDVLQNGEFVIYRAYPNKCTIAHYFRGNEASFLADAGFPGL